MNTPAADVREEGMHRLIAALTMLAGAVAGAALVLNAGVAWALGLAIALLAASGAVVFRCYTARDA